MPHTGGRKKGSKDKVPRSMKASVKRIIEEVVENDPELIRKAVIEGLKARAPKSVPYLTLAAAYVDGKPTEHVTVEATLSVEHVLSARHLLARKLDRLAATRDPLALPESTE